MQMFLGVTQFLHRPGPDPYSSAKRLIVKILAENVRRRRIPGSLSFKHLQNMWWEEFYNSNEVWEYSHELTVPLDGPAVTPVITSAPHVPSVPLEGPAAPPATTSAPLDGPAVPLATTSTLDKPRHEHGTSIGT